MKPLPALIGLDSEDDGRGTPLLFGIVHRRGRSWARDRHIMLERLAELGRRGKVQVWCTNLEYDLLNLFGEERIAELQLRFGKSFLCGATWRKRGVEFRDTMRHVPLSVEKLGALVGKLKIEKELFRDRNKRPSEAQLIRRCLRDAAITYQVARRLRELYSEVGGRTRMTLASSAYNVWLTRFWKREVYRPPAEIWTAAFQAYYGGRTEPFAVGDFRNVAACDASSMFPWAMLQGAFPLPWGAFRRARPGATVEPNGLYRVRVSSNLKLPLLPFRSDHGLIFPNGTWSGWYVGSELQAFELAGGKFRVLSGFTFAHEVRPFDGYIRTMFRRKARSKGARRTFYKLMLNSLYGKFGQRGERVIAVPLETAGQLEKMPPNFRIWAGLALYSEKKEPPPWGNNLWPAIVTARARVRLYHEMQRVRAKGARLLYCDTDGILYSGGKLRYPAKVETPGDFEARGRYRSALIRAKKEYALEDEGGRWSFFAKGVPEAGREQYLKTGEVEFERPVKLREAARSGEKTNVWRAVRKVRHVTFAGRGRTREGDLTPIIVRA